MGPVSYAVLFVVTRASLSSCCPTAVSNGHKCDRQTDYTMTTSAAIAGQTWRSFHWCWLPGLPDFLQVMSPDTDDK